MEKIGRTKIVDLLKRTDIGAMVNVKGWVRTRRGSKQVNFIALNDGSTINNLQIVVDLANFDEEMLKLITTGACISVNGEMVESVGSGQKVEVQAREIEVLGTCDNTYPLQKKVLYGILARDCSLASAYQYIRCCVPHPSQHGDCYSQVLP